jgi:outer membrane translocation and assembly module TamA
MGAAANIFGSHNEFGKVLGRNATYTRLGPKFVLARQTVFGVLPAFTIPPDADPTDPIPIAERFFGGGNLSHRGFPENQAGPRDLKTGFPLGGSAEFFNNTEFRFPLLGENINGVLFHDMGNVYSSIGSMSFRVKQNGLSDFNYMVHAAGFGIRYRTPIGPVRVDLSYSINPPRFNGFSGTYTDLVNCTATNTCTSAVQQINHFQFFFSIGQAF